MQKLETSVSEISSSEIEEIAKFEHRSAHGRQLAGNIIALYVLQGLNYVIPMAVLPFLVRVLGMEQYGLMAFAQSFAQYFTLLTDYGFNFSATRSIAQSKGDHQAISRIFSAVMLVKSALLLVGTLLLTAIVYSVPRFHQNATFFFMSYLAVVGNVLFPVWYFQGIENMKKISAIVGAARVAGGVALFLFIRGPHDTILALAIQSLSLVLGGVVGLWIAFRSSELRFVKPTATELRKSLTDGLHLFISTAAVSLYTNTNVFLVGILAGNLQAGYFSAAEKLIRAIQGLQTPVTQALFPRMNSLAVESKERAMALARRTLRWVGGISFACSTAILFFAGPLIILCFGPSSAASISIIRWIAFLPFLIAISNVLGIQIMLTLGLDRQFSYILIFAGVFNVGLAAPLIHYFGAQGAGASVLCAEVFVTVAMLLVLERHKISIFRGRTPDEC